MARRLHFIVKRNPQRLAGAPQTPTEDTMAQHQRIPRRPVVLVIMDGFGINPSKLNNAVAVARTPRLDEYLFRYPATVLDASGQGVGLPLGQMGNSEVGHLTIGSGCVVRQDLVLIDAAIADGSFFNNPALVGAVLAAAAKPGLAPASPACPPSLAAQPGLAPASSPSGVPASRGTSPSLGSLACPPSLAAKPGRPLHLLGLVSDGGVHSHVGHLLALIELCHRQQVRPLLHMITDGRDTPPRSAMTWLAQVEQALARAGGAIATVSGRFFAMDRDRRWDRVERAWRAIVLGKGRGAGSAEAAIATAYAAGEGDEFIHPSVIGGYRGLQPGDPLISFNFRKDRPRQIAAALASRSFDGFDRGGSPLAEVTCMMEYDPTLGLPHAFRPEAPATTLARVLSEAGIGQLHCAETEKYAHVTYFFNGGAREPLPGEERRMIPSPRVATYDLKPEMSAREVADAAVAAIQGGRYGFIVVNFANGDMVGHTGDMKAAVRAVEALDRHVGRVLDAAVAADWSAIVTADHGNCELMVDPETDEPHTQHTTLPVPFLVVDESRWVLAPAGGLADVAPTVLQLMGLPAAAAMTGQSLLVAEQAARQVPAVERLNAA
jgi:2,3-bisphosphoglycerate-independent phosphoglycerate mutase